MGNEQLQDARLHRIEDKIDKLSDAMISLARTEEKILAMEDNNRASYDRLNRHSEKLDDLDNRIGNNERVVGIINKLVMAGAVAGIGTIVKIWLM